MEWQRLSDGSWVRVGSSQIAKAHLHKGGYSQTGSAPPAPGQVVSDDGGGPAFDSGGGYGANDALRGQDPANLRRRPPLAAPPDSYDGRSTYRGRSDADDDLFTGEVGEGWEKSCHMGQSRFNLAAMSPDGSLALYVNRRDAPVSNPLTFLVKSISTRPQHTDRWADVASVASWRDVYTGRTYRPGLQKAAPNPSSFNYQGRVARLLMDGGDNGAVYGILTLDGRAFQFGIRRSDGSVQLLPGQRNLGNDPISRALLSDVSDGVLAQSKRSARPSLAAGGAD